MMRGCGSRGEMCACMCVSVCVNVRVSVWG